MNGYVGATFVDDAAPSPGGGKGLEFHGSPDRVEVANDPALSFDSSTPFSFSLWLKYGGPVATVHLFGKREECLATGINYQLAIEGANGLQFHSTGGGIVNTGILPESAVWTHCAVTYDGAGILRIYVNGAAVQERTGYVIGGLNSASLYIAASGCSALGNYAGKIDDVWMFGKALTPGEVALLAGLNPSSYCQGKVNSLGCTPVIAATGFPLMSGSDDFHITATGELPDKGGILLWGGGAANLPFGGGTLCLVAPIVRTPVQMSGGLSGVCSGSYDFHFSHAYENLQFLVPGSTVYAQYWSRDPGFPSPNNVALTGGLEFTLCP